VRSARVTAKGISEGGKEASPQSDGGRQRRLRLGGAVAPVEQEGSFLQPAAVSLALLAGEVVVGSTRADLVLPAHLCRFAEDDW